MIPFTRVRYYFLDKGLQEGTSELVITPSELRLARNVHFYEKGSLTKRKGYIKRFTNAIEGTPIITGLYQFIKRDGTKRFICATDKIYYGDDGDASVVEIAGSLTFTPGADGDNFMSMLTFNDKVIGTNGVEVVWSWNVSTNAVALAGSPPIAEIIASYQNFIFLAGQNTFPYRLYFSNDGDETVWTSTDYIDIGDLTSPITGLAVLFGRLYIFTRTRLYELSGFDRDTFLVREISLSTGCTSYKSIVKIDNNLVFFSDRGIYSFDGINVHYLSGNIKKIIEDINYNRIDKVVAELYKAKNQVWFSVSTGSNVRHNKVICMTYNPTASEDAGIKKDDVAFAEYTGMAFNALGLERSITVQDRLFAGNYAGLIFKQDQGDNDNGAGIDFQVKPPPIDAGQPEEFKRFRYIWIFNKQSGNYNLTISYVTDFGVGGSSTTVNLSVAGATSLWGTLVWGTDKWGGDTIVKSRVGLKAKGQFMELTFSNSEADQPITIKGFSVLVQNKGAGRR